MDFGWLPALAGVIVAVVTAAYYVSSIIRESGTLRRIERVNDIVSKMEAESHSRDGLVALRDELVASYLAIRTNTRKTAIRLAVWSVAFYAAGLLCYLAAFGVGLTTPPGVAFSWSGVVLVVVGAILISRAERKLDSSKKPQEA
jgi:uncharacterized membrane-anchored protein